MNEDIPNSDEKPFSPIGRGEIVTPFGIPPLNLHKLLAVTHAENMEKEGI